jgi:hypothetical protein
MNTKHISQAKTFVSNIAICIFLIGIFASTSSFANLADPASPDTKERIDKVIKILLQDSNNTITLGMVHAEFKNRIEQEQSAMAEDERKRKIAQDKLKSQLKGIIDNSILNKNTLFIENAIIEKHKVTPELAHKMVINHDIKAYEVLQDMIVKGKK